ncbi:MAG: c-type cytochrome [Bryobacteraceae bacterium]
MRPVGLLLFLATLAQAQTNPLAGDSKAAETGRGMFRIYCGPCHGIKAQGGRGGPDLTRGVFQAGESDADLFRVIANGVPGTEMTGYHGTFGEDGIWRIIMYIRAAGRPVAAAVAGDRSAGERLFWGKGGCGQCHQLELRGGRFGPDLSRIGRSRNVAHLRESLLDPDADIAPGYSTVSVTGPDGTVIEGVERSRDNFSVQLVDRGGRFRSFVREDVRSIEPRTRSLMPSYRQVLNAVHLENLLAYLAGLGEKRR